MVTRTIKTCTNPQWADAAHTIIICKVQFAEFPAPLDFNATASDPEAHGKQLFADLIAGKYGAIGAYVAPVIKAPSPSVGTKKV